MQRHLVALGLLSAFTSVVACTARSAGRVPRPVRFTSEPDRRSSHSRDVLTARELARHPTLAHATVLDAIVALRPEYVSTTRVGSSGLKPAAPQVVVNGNREGLDALRNIDVSTVVEIRFVRSTEAVARFGSEYYRSGAIVVSTTP